MVLLMELVHHQVTIQHKDNTIIQGCVVEMDEEFIKLIDLKDEINYISISDIARARQGLNYAVEKKTSPKVVMTRAKPKPPQYQDTSNQSGLNDGGYEMPSFITGGDRDFIQESE